MKLSFKQKVIETIKLIPPGRVATYGQIAALAGSPRAALMVGQILKRKSEQYNLPWHRVVGKNGRITILNLQYPAQLQAELLKNEGVRVNKKNNTYFVDYAKHMWKASEITLK